MFYGFIGINTRECRLLILQAPAGGIETREIYFSIFYLLALSAGLYFIVLKKFDDFAVKESGV
ncbi:MAG: hypothetical protein C4554_11500 [Dethiobacter sp.]|jgi:fluoroquinolone transport system permease protein|nr:MAG: hypothetical protein C4554_11500 [Dethiobacter sp.]